MQVCLQQTCEGGRDVLFQSPVFSARIKLGSEDSPISLNRPIYASLPTANLERTENQVTSVRADLSCPPFPVLLRDTLRTRTGSGVFELF